MKYLVINHNNIQYEFEMLERSNQVDVVKDGALVYHIRITPNDSAICSCPGAKYHGKCWHTAIINDLRKLPSINEPWAQWAEEAGEMRK